MIIPKQLRNPLVGESVERHSERTLSPACREDTGAAARLWGLRHVRGFAPKGASSLHDRGRPQVEGGARKLSRPYGLTA